MSETKLSMYLPEKYAYYFGRKFVAFELVTLKLAVRKPWRGSDIHLPLCTF